MPGQRMKALRARINRYRVSRALGVSVTQSIRSALFRTTLVTPKLPDHSDPLD
jgi:hypothetical protein